MRDAADTDFKDVHQKSSNTAFDKWDKAFDSPGAGFIALVKQAKTNDGLRECTGLIIRNLFTRDGDAPLREKYEQALNAIIPKTGTDNPPNGECVEQIITLLGEIKKSRQAKAAEHARKMRDSELGKTDAAQHERREGSDTAALPGLDNANGAAVVEVSNDKQLINQIFSDLVCDRIHHRLDTLNQADKGDTSLPFILSRDFARHFEGLLREHFIPANLQNSRALISRTAQQPPDQYKEYLDDQFVNRANTQNMWDRWKTTWDQLTCPQKLPQKPEAKKKPKLLDRLKREKKKRATFRVRELTIDEWKVKVAEVKAENKKVKQMWALIAKPSDTYQAPQPEDSDLLCQLFAMSATGLGKHINGLRQIAEQENDAGRALSAYAHRKDIDLALLAACFQYPDLFLNDRPNLKRMMTGMEEADIAETYPLVWRYMSKHL